MKSDQPAKTPAEMIALIRRLIDREYRQGNRTGDPAATNRARGLVNVRKFIEQAAKPTGDTP